MWWEESKFVDLLSSCQKLLHVSFRVVFSFYVKILYNKIMKNEQLSILDLFQKLFHNFNSRAMKDATLAFKKHLDDGGKMMLAMGGAMSSAQMGITLAAMIKENKIHAISCTGANLEESVFRLVAHNSYKDYPDYRYFTKEDDEAILNRGERRVTDTSIPEEEAFRVVEPIILKKWKEAEKNGERFFPHEYFYQILLSDELKGKYEGAPEHCWLLEAAKKNLPIVVPGWEDSTLGNIFAGYCKAGEVKPTVMKTGVEYMMYLYDKYHRTCQRWSRIWIFPNRWRNLRRLSDLRRAFN